MKVEVNESKKEKELKFPCLMKGRSGLIVLMTDKERGTVVNASGFHELGECANDWMMSHFKPFNGSITLSND